MGTLTELAGAMRTHIEVNGDEPLAPNFDGIEVGREDIETILEGSRAILKSLPQDRIDIESVALDSIKTRRLQEADEREGNQIRGIVQELTNKISAQIRVFLGIRQDGLTGNSELETHIGQHILNWAEADATEEANAALRIAGEFNLNAKQLATSRYNEVLEVLFQHRENLRALPDVLFQTLFQAFGVNLVKKPGKSGANMAQIQLTFRRALKEELQAVDSPQALIADQTPILNAVTTTVQTYTQALVDRAMGS